MAYIRQPATTMGPAHRRQTEENRVFFIRSGVAGSEAVHYHLLPDNDVIVAKQYRAVPPGEQYAKILGFDLYYLDDCRKMRLPVPQWGEPVMSDVNPSARPGTILKSALEQISSGTFPVDTKRPRWQKLEAQGVLPRRTSERPAQVVVQETMTGRNSTENPRVPVDRDGLSLRERLQMPVNQNWREVLAENERLAREERAIPSLRPDDSVTNVAERLTGDAPRGQSQVVPPTASGRDYTGREETILPAYAESTHTGEIRIDVGPDIDVAQAIAVPVIRARESAPAVLGPRRRTAITESVVSNETGRSTTVSVSRSTIENIVSRAGPDGLTVRERASLLGSLRNNRGDPIGPALERINDPPQDGRSRINYFSTVGSTSIRY